MNTQHLNHILEVISFRVPVSKIDMNVYNYFSDINNNNMWYTNRNYDCSEIADDFEEINPQGDIYVIKNGSKKLGLINVIEYNKSVSFVDHKVYVLNGVAYDPRLYNKVILWEDYIRFLKGLNTDIKLSITKE